MFTKEEKLRALRLYDECGSVDEAIKKLGYPTRRCMYNWIEQRKGRNYRHESLPGPRKEPIRSDSWVVSTRSSRQDDQTYLIKQLRQMQMMIDIFSEILHLRDGTDRDTLAGLSPEEATKVIDRLRDRYSLMELTETLGLKRSSYHYQKALSTKQ